MAVVTDKQFLLIGAAVVFVGGVLAWKLSNVAEEAVDTVGGVLTGENELTEGTPYEGAGVLGSLGAATNAISGGALQSIGEWTGSALYDLLN